MSGYVYVYSLMFCICHCLCVCLCLCVCSGVGGCECRSLTVQPGCSRDLVALIHSVSDHQARRQNRGCNRRQTPTNLLMELSPSKGAYRATVYPRGLPQMYIKLHTCSPMSLALVIASCDIIYILRLRRKDTKYKYNHK